VNQPKAVRLRIVPDASAPTGKKRYRLVATVPAGANLTPGSDLVQLRTDHPKVGSLTVPVAFIPHQPSRDATGGNLRLGAPDASAAR
jgi:hypothetical protein